MATITDVFSHIYTTEAHLANVPVKNGQIILCVDSEKLYIDKGTVRISTSDIVKVSNYDALPIAPLDKLYITEDGKLYLYINNAWKELSTDLDTSRLLPANPEEKTILGYENGSWVGIPSGTFVQSINGTYTSTGAITIPNATTTDAGLMSAEDKVKLNNLSDGYLTTITTGQGLSGAGTAASPLTLNLSNYSTDSTIKMVSAAGAVNLISNTGEAGLYSGSNVYVKALTDTVELKATTVSLNGHAQNTSGGFVVVDSSTGKIPASIVPETTGSVDLSAYNGLVGITTTGVSAISNGASGEYKFTLGTNGNGVILTEDGSTRSVTIRSTKKIYLDGGEISIVGYPFKIHSNGKLELSSSMGNIILNAQDSVDANIEMHGTGILWNGAALNTTQGLVQLDASGKVPESLLPEIGNASWTKVTLNQADFATEDTTYGGSYKELDGICSVEVYDAGGYKVEFDVKCDFTGMKTRIYIPSSLSASTISNWTLLYLAKTIA